MRTTYESYIKQGFYLVPITSGKGPKTANWNRKENCITDANLIPDHVGVGLAHSYSGTCSIDIDDWTVACQTLGFVGIDLKGLFDAPDSVAIHSGNPGHAKLIYRLPFGITLPSKKCIHTTPEGIKKNWIDFRCATADGLTVQDVLPGATRHPVTQQHYQWSGNGHYTNIPLIPGELLAYWRSIIDAEEQRTIKVDGSQVSASWDEIKQALTCISPDCDRDQWVTVLMALHYAGTVTNKLDEALVVADEWSAQSATKYKGQQDILNSWRGFKPDKGVTLGSLFHFAKQGGWERPLPDVSSLFTAAIDEIESPRSLADQLATPKPSVDFDLFPTLLAQRAKEVAVSMACDPLTAACAGLAAAAGAVDARTRLQLMPGWDVPPVLWLMTIGSPSAKKTPASKPMMGVLKQIENEHKIIHAAEQKIFEARDAAFATAHKAYMAAAGNPEWLLGGGDVGSLPMVPEKPIPPVEKVITVSDITSQKLVRMAADRPQGLLCHLDEMLNWCKKLVGQTGESRASWITGYDCNSQPMDRVGDGSAGSGARIIADNYAISIYSNCQPKVFRAYVKELTEDGLLQRFIPAIVRDEYSDRLNEPIPEHLTSAAAYEQHIRLIHALPPTTYRLSQQAFEQYRDFQRWYIQLKRDERLLNADDEYITAIGKLEGTAGRIILFWHLFDNPHSQEVSGETCAKAIAFTTKYVANALRYLYAEVGGMTTDSVDTHVRDYVMQHAAIDLTVTLSELKRSARRKLEHLPLVQQNELILSAMQVLERANWVKCIEQNGRTTVWAIDARVANIFPDHRKAVVAAKQRLADRLHETSEGRIPHRRVVGSDILD
jgi:hypothetical protein